MCFSKSEEEADGPEGEGLHGTAASIEERSLHSKIEELCGQLVDVYTKMVLPLSFSHMPCAVCCIFISYSPITSPVSARLQLILLDDFVIIII